MYFFEVITRREKNGCELKMLRDGVRGFLIVPDK